MCLNWPCLSKQDGRLHGLGLNRASATAREYGGQLTYGYDGGVFTASISFLGGVKGKAKYNMTLFIHKVIFTFYSWILKSSEPSPFTT